MADGIKTVLFLCTGNFYRSRHVEAVFNGFVGFRFDSDAGLRVHAV